MAQESIEAFCIDQSDSHEIRIWDEPDGSITIQQLVDFVSVKRESLPSLIEALTKLAQTK